MKNSLSTIIVIVSILLFNTHPVKAEGKSSEINKNLYEIIEDVEFTFSIDDNLNKNKKLPIITIYMQYNSNDVCDIIWDERFYFLLWSGIFLLEIESQNNEIDTRNLHIMTGGIFLPHSRYTLFKGIIITSVLDFNNSGPGMIRPEKGRNNLIFYIKDKDGNFKKIGNELVVNIK